jgi:hypothetical protein
MKGPEPVETRTDFNLMIAGNACEVICDDSRMAAYLGREFRAFAGGDGSDILIRLSVNRSGRAAPPPGSTGGTRVSLPGGPTVDMNRSGGGGSIGLEVTVYREDGDNDADGTLFESFLASYMLTLAMQNLQEQQSGDILLVHACGVESAGMACLFAGASGSGKSTIARELQAAGYKVLGDDMIPVSRQGDRWLAHGSPMGGDIPRDELSNDDVPLGGIFLLDRAVDTCWKKMGGGEAAVALMGLLVPSYPLGVVAPERVKDYEPESIGLLLDAAALLSQVIPCFNLRLSLEQRPWREIFELIKGGNRSDG